MADAPGSRVVIYTTEPCWYCHAAKALLDERNIRYDEVLLPDAALGRARLFALTRGSTFPQIMIDGHCIGGYRELVVADRAGTLTEVATED